MNSTVVTRVTIGGTTAGMPIPLANVVLGDLPTETAPARVLQVSPPSRQPNQFLDITVPPWQGERVPLVVFKVFQSGTTAGSDPYYIDIFEPVATSVDGITGRTESALVPAFANTNGTSRVRITGNNVGRNFTRIIFLNARLSRVQGEFFDCERDFGYVECTAPPGVGSHDDGDPANGVAPAPLRIALLQPGLRCDPGEQGTSAIAWDRCSIVINTEMIPDVVPRDGWVFRYQSPDPVRVSGALPADGGIITVWGYNFGQVMEDVVAWLEPRAGSPQARISLTTLGTNVTTDAKCVTVLVSFGVWVCVCVCVCVREGVCWCTGVGVGVGITVRVCGCAGMSEPERWYVHVPTAHRV